MSQFYRLFPPYCMDYQVGVPYDVDLDQIPENFHLRDHLGGFDANNENQFLRKLNNYAKTHGKRFCIQYHQILSKQLVERYQNLKIEFDIDGQNFGNLAHFLEYRYHPAIDYKNFVCSFNGTPHVSRKLLVSILQKFGYFNDSYCSKNFSYDVDLLVGQLQDYVGDRISFYRKFFISDDSEDFFKTKYSFGHTRFDHSNNIYALENKITQSFLHVVSESLATSYYPFVTEKFLYSIVTRGLFLAYAQPEWHQHLEKYYGFKKYTQLFDYRFDSIQNPVERLTELMTMISKFRLLTQHEWHDLYLLEQDTIEYNYDHYFSGDYLKCLKQYSEC